MHIPIPHIRTQPDADTERLKAQIGVLRIECRSLCEQLEQRRIDYAATLAERDAFSKAYTAAQLQLSAMCERNDELNAELAEARAECAAHCALLRRAISTSVISPDLRSEIETATQP